MDVLEKGRGKILWALVNNVCGLVRTRAKKIKGIKWEGGVDI
jgi:hypothetical protein